MTRLLSRPPPLFRRSGVSEVGGIVLIAAVVSAIFFHRILFGRGLYVALDLLTLHIPFMTFARRALAAGELPLWSSQLQMGLAFMANGNTTLLYPLGFLFFVMDPAKAVAWELWLHAALSVVTMYAFARLSLRVGPIAALAAGLVFAFGGYQLSHTGLMWAVYEGPWIPLVFLGLERALNGRLAWAWVAPAAVAMAILAGNPQELYYAGLFLPLFLALLVLQRPGLRPALRALALLSATVLGGLLLAAIQAVPEAELVSLGERAGRGLSFADASIFPLPRTTPWALLLPDYSRGFFGENGAWIGAIGLVLMVVGAVGGLLQGTRRWLTLFFVLMAAACFVLALGAQTPLYRLVFDWVPGMHQFRIPVRWLYPMAFAVACLVALGGDLLLRILPEDGRRRNLGIAALGSLSLILLLAAATPAGHHLLVLWGDRYGLRRATAIAIAIVILVLLGGRLLALPRSVAGWALPLAVVIELFASSQFMEWNHPGPPDTYKRQPPIAAYVAGHGPGRVLPIAPGGYSTTIDRLDKNAPLLFATTSSVLGFSSNWPTARDQAVDTMATQVAQQPARAADLLPLWRLLDIRYVVGTADQDGQGLGKVQGLASPMNDGSLMLYQLVDPGRRLRTSCGARFEPDARVILDRITRPDYSPDDLYVEGEGQSRPGSPCGQAVLQSETNNSVTASVTMPGPGWLMLADSWYPGWQATIDGKPATIRRADYFFRAVAVPEGTHRVVFRYRPASFTAGAVISVVALLLWIASLVWVFLGSRRPPFLSARR